jgi:hypothetical protein
VPKEIFISYAHQDMRWAELVCGQLEDAGLSCWIAPRDVAPGTTWPAAITEAISQCHAMIIIVSTYANESKQMAREVERADSRQVPILPVRVENVTPAGDLEYFLGNRQWFDLHDHTIERRIGGLPEAVAGLLGESGASLASGTAASPRRGTAKGRLRWLGAGVGIASLAAIAFFAWPHSPSHPAQVTTAATPATSPSLPPTSAPAVAAPTSSATPRTTPSPDPSKASPAPASKAHESKPDFSGRWEATVTYSEWGTQREIFDFKADEDKLSGTASFLTAARGITNGKIERNTISFTTRSMTRDGDKTYQETHRYVGRLSGDTIDFILQTDSGDDDSPPPETFTAKRQSAPPKSPNP